MASLKYLFSLPARWLHRRGFGVQSPWAYEIVRDALFDTNHFYAFDKLNGDSMDEQLFRLVHKARPNSVYLIDTRPKSVDYVRAARASANIVVLKVILLENLPEFAQDSCVIVENIDKANTAVWQSFVKSPIVTTSFEMRTRGIAFFDKARQKQNYLL